MGRLSSLHIVREWTGKRVRQRYVARCRPLQDRGQCSILLGSDGWWRCRRDRRFHGNGRRHRRDGWQWISHWCDRRGGDADNTHYGRVISSSCCTWRRGYSRGGVALHVWLRRKKQWAKSHKEFQICRE